MDVNKSFIKANQSAEVEVNVIQINIAFYLATLLLPLVIDDCGC